MSEDKTLKELLSELIESLDYFRLMVNMDAVVKILISIDDKLSVIIGLLKEKRGHIDAEIGTLEGDNKT